ncbi:hypothetical protein EJB05_32318, partial [Eragrostis curvula]
MATFRIAGASEYLAITGWGVDGVKLVKKAWVWLGQSCTTLDAAPASYELEAHGVTADKFPVVLHTVCTVGPKIDDQKQLGEADPLLPAARRSNRKLVEGVVEVRVRALAAGMTAEQVSAKGAAGFATLALETSQPDLGKYGLRVYSATVERLAVHVPAPANNKVNVVAAPAAMGLSVQVGHGSTTVSCWSSKVEVVNLSVATKKAGSCVYKQTKVTKMKAILEDEAGARQQQAAGVQIKVGGVQSQMAVEQMKMAGEQIKMAMEQVKMAGEQVKMAGAQSKMAGVHIKMAGVQCNMAGVHIKMAGV